MLVIVEAIKNNYIPRKQWITTIFALSLWFFFKKLRHSYQFWPCDWEMPMLFTPLRIISSIFQRHINNILFENKNNSLSNIDYTVMLYLILILLFYSIFKKHFMVVALEMWEYDLFSSYLRWYNNYFIRLLTVMICILHTTEKNNKLSLIKHVLFVPWQCAVVLLSLGWTLSCVGWGRLAAIVACRRGLHLGRPLSEKSYKHSKWLFRRTFWCLMASPP